MSFTPSSIPTLVDALPLRKFSNPNGGVRSRSVKREPKASDRSLRLEDGKEGFDDSSQKYERLLGLDRCMIE
jgi:hypothetical protein